MNDVNCVVNESLPPLFEHFCRHRYCICRDLRAFVLYSFSFIFSRISGATVGHKVDSHFCCV